MADIQRGTYDALAEHLAERATVVAKPDGSAVIERWFEKGSVRFDVVACDGENRALLVTTPYPDLASHVFDSHDGRSRPWDPRYLPRGMFDGGADPEAKRMRVLAVGSSVAEAVVGLADSLGYGPDTVAVDHVEEGDGQWDCRFSMDGTGMRAGGHVVPGGYVVTEKG